MFKSKNQNQSGFTLVELLVVIAIIGILSSVAVVNLNSAREKAKDAVAKDSLVSLINATRLCFDSGGELTEPVADTDICNNNSDNKWPNLEEDGWEWDSANSNSISNMFCYTATKIDPSPESYYGFRCKATGCYELIGLQLIDEECNPPVGP